MPPRQKVNINQEWKFKIGDETGAQQIAYDDKSWSNVNLPHNFSISYFKTSQWYLGYEWYHNILMSRRNGAQNAFSLNLKRSLEKRGSVNGQEVGQHHGSYTGFTFDITDELKPGPNILYVSLNNIYNPRLVPLNGDHNFTGGIYRDVYLVVLLQLLIPD